MCWKEISVAAEEEGGGSANINKRRNCPGEGKTIKCGQSVISVRLVINGLVSLQHTECNKLFLVFRHILRSNGHQPNQSSFPYLLLCSMLLIYICILLPQV